MPGVFGSRGLGYVLVAALGLAMACSSGGRERGGTTDPGGDDGGTPPATGCSPGGPEVVCRGDMELTCADDGTVTSTRNCADEGLTCAAGLGCTVCTPGRGGCDGNTTRVCNDEGTGWIDGETCDATVGEMCIAANGTCQSLCKDAEASNSYIGCEYWPTPTLNSQLATEFAFAVVVTNPQTMPAAVTVSRGGSTVATVTVPPGGLETIELDYLPQLKQTTGNEVSALVRRGAYRLRSTVPVTVYQFNPLEYRIDQDCADEGILDLDNECFSFSNDASLLLPSHVLTGNYMAMSWKSMMTRRVVGEADPVYLTSPGFFTIIGVEESPVEVQLNYRGYVTGGGEVAAAAPGETGTFTLEQGDVLQVVGSTPAETSCPEDSPQDVIPETGTGIFRRERQELTYCTLSPDYDLTGTEIRASGKVAVVGGHNCAFVPYNRWACDHLEEAMFPLETLGKEYLVAATEPLRGEPNIVRILSAHDGNTVSFSPAVHEDVTLDRGELIEFETDQDFRVTGSDAFMVAHFLVGQDYAGIGEAGMGGQGDPAFSLGIPSEQFRTSYNFLAPSTFEVSYVNVTAPAGTMVNLDGSAVSGWRPVGDTGMTTARVVVSGGAHEISSDLPFGIEVYGFGAYTSYIYPGGLDFEEINVPF